VVISGSNPEPIPTAADTPPAVLFEPEHGPPPRSVSPSEWVASEGTLIRMLCRHYGWVSLASGQLLRHRK
jgi:hypothetical protein